MNVVLLEQRLSAEEGLRLKPYRDTVGKLTIGVGRNLDDVGISIDEAMLMLANDISRTVAALRKAHPWFDGLDEVRQEVLADMAFNMGEAGIDTFVTTLACVQAGRYIAAADAMGQSKWASQVGARAVTLETAMRTGAWPT